MTARRAARRLLTWGVRGRRERGPVWGEAVLGEFEETTGTWEAIRWAASGLRVVLRERLRPLVATRLNRLGTAVLALVVLGLLANWLAVGVVYVPSASMSPTLRIADRALVDKVTFRWTGVHDGDVVIFTVRGTQMVKRVIGLPGETISCRDGRVYRDGTALAEPYVPLGGRTDCTTVTVPAGSVYLLGDDRPVAMDSRQLGPVPLADVSGRVVTRIWPLTRVGGP